MRNNNIHKVIKGKLSQLSLTGGKNNSVPPTFLQSDTKRESVLRTFLWADGKSTLLSFFLLLILPILLLSSTGCSKEEKTEASPEKKSEIITSVQVIEPEFSYISDKLTFPGVTSPHTITYASFLVSGKISSLNYHVGQAVKKGDLLATLDSEMYQRQVGVASAAVNAAEAQRLKVNTGARHQEIEMAKRNMLQAQSGFDLAKKEKDRFSRLYKIDAIPRRDYDQVMTQYKIRKEQFEAASQQYDLVKEGASREDKLIAGANVEVNRAQLAQASTQLAYTRLYSPMTGIITEKKAEVGTVINAGMPVYEIQSMDSIDLEVFIPSVHLEKVKMGEKADVTFMENPDEKIIGVVREIKPMSDSKTRSYRVKIRLSSTPHLKSYAGTIGKATFNGNKVYGAFVPVACIVSSPDNDENYVFLIDNDNRAHKVTVQMLKIKDHKALIKGTFPKDAKLVLSGQEYLEEGSKVRIVSALDSQRYVTPDKSEKPKDYGSRL